MLSMLVTDSVATPARDWVLLLRLWLDNSHNLFHVLLVLQTFLQLLFLNDSHGLLRLFWSSLEGFLHEQFFCVTLSLQLLVTTVSALVWVCFIKIWFFSSMDLSEGVLVKIFEFLRDKAMLLLDILVSFWLPIITSLYRRDLYHLSSPPYCRR